MFGLGLDAAHQDHREVVVDVALGLIRATTEAFRVPAHHAIGEFLSDMPRRASLAHIEASIPRRTSRPLGGPTNDDFGPWAYIAPACCEKHHALFVSGSTRRMRPLN